MGRYFSLLTLVAALALVPRSSARQHSILPDRFGAWVATQTSLSGAPGDSASSVNAERDALYKETGAEREESRTYTAGDRQISVSVTRFRDSSGAYEFYTHGLQVGMTPWDAGEMAAVGHDSATVLEGNVVIFVHDVGKVSVGDVKQLVASLNAIKMPLPPIRAFLPEEDLVNGTQRYALGAAGLRYALDPYISSIVGTQSVEDAQREQYLHIADQIGFSSGAEAMLAQYKGAKGSAVLLLLDYPTPQLAELHLRHLQTALPEDANAAKVTIERKGSLLSLMLTSSSPEYSEAIRQNINFHTQVTWNEPSSTATDQPWSVILYRIFVGTGVFMVLAVIFGVLFGGIRVFTKRYFPGKIFDRPKSIEILQLGLSGKRIDPSDFY